MAAEAMTDEHDLLDAARNGDQDASARLVHPRLAQPRACCHRMLRPHFAQDTERWIWGPARISTSEATDPASQQSNEIGITEEEFIERAGATGTPDQVAGHVVDVIADRSYSAPAYHLSAGGLRPLG